MSERSLVDLVCALPYGFPSLSSTIPLWSFNYLKERDESFSPALQDIVFRSNDVLVISALMTVVCSVLPAATPLNPYRHLDQTFRMSLKQAFLEGLLRNSPVSSCAASILSSAMKPYVDYAYRLRQIKDFTVWSDLEEIIACQFLTMPPPKDFGEGEHPAPKESLEQKLCDEITIKMFTQRSRRERLAVSLTPDAVGSASQAIQNYMARANK